MNPTCNEGKLYTVFHFTPQCDHLLVDPFLGHNPLQMPIQIVQRFMISMTSIRDFRGFTFAAFNGKNIPEFVEFLINLSLIEYLMSFLIKSTHLWVRLFLPICC